MTLDTTEIGVVAARVMEDLERDVAEGRMGSDPRVIAALVIYEVAYTDEDGDHQSAVGCRVTEDRNVLALGRNARAYQALTDPDDE